MIGRLARDPIVRIAVLLWLSIASLYFIPQVPLDFLMRLGDRYSTLSLWPWAIAACLVGLSKVPSIDERRFWLLQGCSVGALLAIEIPWALARASNTVAWNVAAEWCYFAYYAGQLMSAAHTPRGRAMGAAAPLAAAVALSVLAFINGPLYLGSWASYGAYLTFDAAMAVTFWRLRRHHAEPWLTIYAGLAATSAIVLAVDALDMLSYVGIHTLSSGVKTDLLWMLPPLCYVLVARFGRQRLETAS